MATSSSDRLHLPPSCRRLPSGPSNIRFRAATAGACRLQRLPGVATARPLRIRAHTGAARQIDHDGSSSSRGIEAKDEEDEERQPRLRIAIVGFGNYGQFLARTLVAQGHTVLAHSRSDHSAAAASLGALFFPDAHDLCECHPDVVVLATSILSARDVILSLPLHRLRRDTLFADVLSVKEFPRNRLLGALPPEFDIICTHPMFGPESARDGWAGLPFIFDRVRVRDGCPARRARAEAFLGVFEREGCRMVEIPCAEHDAHAAETQFLTHTVGRMLAELELRPAPISTRGYETLLRLVDNTCSDSFDLYNGLFMYNQNATDLLNRLDRAMDSVKKRLYEGLHGVARKQLFGFEGSPGASADPTDELVASHRPDGVLDTDHDDDAAVDDGDESANN